MTLDSQGSYYIRLVDLSTVLSEEDSLAWRSMVMGLSVFLEMVDGIVINRPGSQAHNGSKPLHEWWLAKKGFDVPPAITSSDKNQIASFLMQYGNGIVKTLCGMRGTAQLVSISDFDNFSIQQGPVHVQKFIKGYDLRIHVIGEDVHVEKIECDEVDYRDRNSASTYSNCNIPDQLTKKIKECSKEIGLIFSGWDFKVDKEGRYWCLEVNPMPGYDIYDKRANGRISTSLINYLKYGH